ncbi:uncharacterized protein METZ01_LOCUS387156 [marine metagenome]|uniref:Uncharacterized protein n=1 Tax=marine metagenome TaxID=408172 RepID=A0A382UJH7_9ZZZZ
MSNTIVAEAMLARDRSSDPEKIMSAVLRPRKSEKDCSPRTQRTPSAMLLFPDPLGPTMQVTSPNSILVFAAKVL